MRSPRDWLRHLLTVSLVLVASCGVVACSAEAPADGTEATGDRLQIVATTGMIGDVVAAVAGERADVETLIKAGVDPHLYSATRNDIAQILKSDAVFYNGLLLEGKMADALVRAASGGKPVFAVTELVDQGVLLSPEDLEGLYDPHVWMDPTLWARAVEVVRDAMMDIDPASSAQYSESADRYLAEIRELDGYAERVLSTVSESSRVLITAHDAFRYFGRRYGFEVLGIQGLSTESEAGLRDIERLVDVIVDRGIAAVFVESTVSDRNISALVAGARARGHEVTIGGALFSDAMGPAGTYEGTYIGMIDHNVTTIVRALGGEAPPAGMAGRLGEAPP